jgi:hypothetical protein
VVKSLAELPISVDGLTVPGIATGEIDQRSGLPVRGAARPLAEFASANALASLLNEPDPRTDDESLFFVAAWSSRTTPLRRCATSKDASSNTGTRSSCAARRLPSCRPRALSSGLRLQVVERELAEARP